MKRRLLAHIEMCRPYTIFYVGLVSLAGAFLAAPDPTFVRLIGAWLAPTLGWIAGLYGGDYFDRHLDAIAKPHRPIPSGRVSARLAFWVMVIAIAVGAVIGLTLNWRNLIVAALTTVLGISYNKILKARGFVGNLVRGGPMAFTFIFGMLATTPVPPWSLYPLALIFLLHDTGTNLIGTLRDIDGDRAGGYQTFPVRHGVRATLFVLLALAVGWLGLATIYPAILLSLPWDRYAPLLGVAAALYLGTQALLWSAPDSMPRQLALRAHSILVLERIILAGAFIAAGASLSLALTIIIPCLALTWIAQKLLRERYEFTEPEPVDAEAIRRYVADQVARIDKAPTPLKSLSRWQRRLHIRITDCDLDLWLWVERGKLKLVDPELFEASELPAVRIFTTSDIFRNIFLTRRTNPRRAYLQGKIKLDCTPRDMLSLNQVFTEFRRGEVSPSQAPSVTVIDQQPDEPMPEVQPSVQVVLSDTTLRDGEQMPGIAFSIEEKIRLARILDDIGVPLIEVGFPVVSPEEACAIKEIVALRLNALTQAIARPHERDIDAAVACGVDSIAIFIGTSDSHVFNKLRLTHAEILSRVERAVAYAAQSGLQIVFAAEDATRTPLPFLLEVYRTAVGAGATALGLADTAGISTPQHMEQLVQSVTEAVAVPLAVHCHNDLGLATANTIAGVVAGASGAQCSLLGIGERAGNAPLEEVALALEVAYGRRTGLKLHQLLPAATTLSAMIGHPILPNKAVLGNHAFVHESGLHTDGVVRDPSTYEPYPPELTGQRREFMFGKHSGRSAIIQSLARHNIPYDDTLCAALLAEVKRLGQMRRPLNEQGLIELARSLGTPAVPDPYLIAGPVSRKS
jgi:isopropylmalate/homocitrate/citramalate synthase/4-hydroxybenzoate polyprenyltransferase